MKLAPGTQKISVWAAHPEVRRTPRIANLPRFGSRKFNSYDEFNRWKDGLIRELIRSGGARWTR